MLATFTLMGQNEAFEHMLERSMEEKIKIDLNTLSGDWKVDHNSKNVSATKASNVVVSDKNVSESEVHAALNPNDSSRIVISPIANSGTSGLLCPLYYSDDFGKTWNESAFQNMPSVPGNISVGGGDPVLAYDDSSRVYMTWIDLSVKNMNVDNAFWGMYWAWSDDNGQTWNYDTTNVIEESTGSLNNIGSFNGPLTDKQWMAVDRNPNSAYYNDLYVSYVEIDAQTQQYKITVVKKKADTLAFDSVKTYVTGGSFAMVQFASITVDRNGRVHVSFFGSYDNTNYKVFHSYSDDGGQTFSTPVEVSGIQLPQYSSGQQNTSVSGINDDRFYPAIYNASSPTSDHVYITWTANGQAQKESEGLDVFFTRSTSGGNSFEQPYIINDDTSKSIHQFYSSINVSPSGRVDVAWYDRRDDTTNNLNTNYYIASSYDQGQSFGKNAKITGMSTDFSTVGDQNNDFGVGEYNMVLSTNDYIIPVWADGRKNNGDLDIYAAFVHKNSLSVERLTSIKNDFIVQRIFPNPTSDIINCRIEAQKTNEIQLQVLNLEGKILSKRAITTQPGINEIQVETSEYSPGIYILLFQGDNGRELRKIIRQ